MTTTKFVTYKQNLDDFVTFLNIAAITVTDKSLNTLSLEKTSFFRRREFKINYRDHSNVMNFIKSDKSLNILSLENALFYQRHEFKRNYRDSLQFLFVGINQSTVLIMKKFHILFVKKKSAFYSRAGKTIRRHFTEKKFKRPCIFVIFRFLSINS